MAFVPYVRNATLAAASASLQADERARNAAHKERVYEEILGIKRKGENIASGRSAKRHQNSPRPPSQPAPRAPRALRERGMSTDPNRGRGRGQGNQGGRHNASFSTRGYHNSGDGRGGSNRDGNFVPRGPNNNSRRGRAQGRGHRGYRGSTPSNRFQPYVPQPNPFDAESSATPQDAASSSGTNRFPAKPNITTSMFTETTDESGSGEETDAASESDTEMGSVTLASFEKRMTDKWTRLKAARETERAHAIQSGMLADPEKKTSLANAIKPVGRCEEMCPEFERAERIVQKMVDKSEKLPSRRGKESLPDERMMVKRFRRSAAGTDEQLPSDLRTPKALKQSTDYLIDQVVGRAEQLGSVHKFVWDRTRAIRNDITILQFTSPADVRIAIYCLERIARFHILSLHHLSRVAVEQEFNAYQDREQLNATLVSLRNLYDDSRDKVVSPNEPEFRAYSIVLESRPDLEDHVQSWPRFLLRDGRVQMALKLQAAKSNALDRKGPLQPSASFNIAQANHGGFFKLVKSDGVSYLMACVAEMFFNEVREMALQNILSAYKIRGAADRAWPLKDLMTALCFDNEEETREYSEAHGIVFGVPAGEDYMNLSATNLIADAVPSRQQAFSELIVELKSHNRTLPEVIHGVKANPQNMGIEEREAGAEMDEDESLFVKQDEPEPPPAANPTPQPFVNPFLLATSMLNKKVQSPGTPSLNPNASPFQPTPSVPGDQRWTPDKGVNFGTTSSNPSTSSASSFGAPTSMFPSKTVTVQATPPSTNPVPPAPSSFGAPTPIAPLNSTTSPAASSASPFKPSFGTLGALTSTAPAMLSTSPLKHTFGTSGAPTSMAPPKQANAPLTSSSSIQPQVSPFSAVAEQVSFAPYPNQGKDAARIATQEKEEEAQRQKNLARLEELAKPTATPTSQSQPTMSPPTENQAPESNPFAHAWTTPQLTSQPATLTPPVLQSTPPNLQPATGTNTGLNFISTSTSFLDQAPKAGGQTSFFPGFPTPSGVPTATSTPKPLNDTLKFGPSSFVNGTTPRNASPAPALSGKPGLSSPTPNPTPTITSFTPNGTPLIAKNAVQAPTRPAMAPQPQPSLLSRTAEPASRSSQLSAAKVKQRQEEVLDRFVRTFFIQRDGVLEHFVENAAAPIIQDVMREMKVERAQKAWQKVRNRYLARKYGALWRKRAYVLFRMRDSKERRKRLRELGLKQRLEDIEKRKASGISQNDIKEVHINAGGEGSHTPPHHMTYFQTSPPGASVPGGPSSKPHPSRKRKSVDSEQVQMLKRVRAALAPKGGRQHKRSKTMGNDTEREEWMDPNEEYEKKPDGRWVRKIHNPWRMNHKVDWTKTDYFACKAAGIDPLTSIVPPSYKLLEKREAEKKELEKKKRGRDEGEGAETETKKFQKVSGSERRQSGHRHDKGDQENHALISYTPTPSPPPERKPWSPEDEPVIRESMRLRKLMEEDEARMREERLALEKEEVELAAKGKHTPRRNYLPTPNGHGNSSSRRPYVRTISRTEERIARTGAHGLAYKPVQWKKPSPMSKQQSQPSFANDSSYEQDGQGAGSTDMSRANSNSQAATSAVQTPATAAGGTSAEDALCLSD